MTTIDDPILGTITIRRHARAKGIKASIRPDGQLGITIGPYVPLLAVRRMMHAQHKELQALFVATPRTVYRGGDTIGKSHYLMTQIGAHLGVKRIGQTIIVTLPPGLEDTSPEVQQTLRPALITALKKEAKAHLPHRLSRLAKLHGLTYQTVRFSHASSRWGSCSSQGTISLNVALMKLPRHLIDYVLCHELSHTIHMNHSQKFWGLLTQLDPDWHAHRKELRTHSPHI